MKDRKVNELEDLLALQTLQYHIAQPCSRELLGEYLEDLQGLIKLMRYNWIREMAQTIYKNGKQYYDYLIREDKEPTSAV